MLSQLSQSRYGGNGGGGYNGGGGGGYNGGGGGYNGGGGGYGGGITHLDVLSGIQDVMMNQSSIVRRSCALINSPQVVEEADLQLDGGKVSRVVEVRKFYTLFVYYSQ